MVEMVWFAHFGEFLLGSKGDVLRAGHFREQHHEFIPTLAANGVGAAHASYQALCDGLEKLIANRMAEVVVDTLEVIHIEK